MSDPIEDARGHFQSDEVVAGLRQAAANRAALLGPATATMMDVARLQPGSRVLDVGAG